MARGESAKDRPQGPGLAIGAVFGALCLASLTAVVTCSDLGGCAGCAPTGLWGPAPPSEPFAGAVAALGELGWRDVGRARASYTPPVGPDAAAARAALDAALRARGYLDVQPADDARAQDLPFDARIDALDGACGVVAVLGVATATLHSLEAPDGAVSAADPSVVTLAACGAIAIRALGAGRATIAVWLLPGVTPADVAATGVPAEALLAHAEAEALWRARGWEPTDALVRIEHAGVTTSGAPSVAPPGTPPPSGCVAWSGVALGAGRAETSATTGGVYGRDYALERALFGALSCAGGTQTRTHVVDPGGDGFVVYWRAWGSGGGGPRRAGAPGARAVDVGGMRVIGEAEIELPEGL